MLPIIVVGTTEEGFVAIVVEVSTDVVGVVDCLVIVDDANDVVTCVEGSVDDLLDDPLYQIIAFMILLS